MNVTRDVIVDLWPLYESGEASEDTRALVDAFLRDDPEFARRIREGEETMSHTLTAPPIAMHPDAERAALARTQLLLRLRYYFLAFACTLTASAVLLRQFRSFSVTVAILSAATWIVVWQMARNPRLASLLPPPRVETRAQRIWSGFRTLALGVAVIFTLLAPMAHPRQRFYPAAVGFAGVLAWLGLVLAEKLTGRRK